MEFYAIATDAGYRKTLDLIADVDVNGKITPMEDSCCIEGSQVHCHVYTKEFSRNMREEYDRTFATEPEYLTPKTFISVRCNQGYEQNWLPETLALEERLKDAGRKTHVFSVSEQFEFASVPHI